MTDKQNQTATHPAGRDMHPDKSVKHSNVGAQSQSKGHNPTVKSGGDKGYKGQRAAK